MEVVAQVVDGRSVSEVRVLDQLETAEGVECPVHGGPMHIRCDGLHARMDLLGGEVIVGRDEYLDHRASGARDALLLGAERFTERVHSVHGSDPTSLSPARGHTSG